MHCSDQYEKICIQVGKFTDMIPMSFVLGFYVSIVISRWWDQFMHIAWPDRSLHVLGLYLRHHTANEHNIEKCERCEAARIMRRTLVRWLNLASVITFRDVSQSVKDRFPTLDHIKSAGFMTDPELELYEKTNTIHLKYWIPFTWFSNLLAKGTLFLKHVIPSQPIIWFHSNHVTVRFLGHVIFRTRIKLDHKI